jgi:hypothetical protein
MSKGYRSRLTDVTEAAGKSGFGFNKRKLHQPEGWCNFLFSINYCKSIFQLKYQPDGINACRITTYRKG